MATYMVWTAMANLGALTLKTAVVSGNKTVTNQERWGTVHMVENGKRTWIFNELGELILAELTPEGFHEFGRSNLIAPTTPQLSRRGNRGVCWAHPAFANRHIFARSDEKLVCASLVSKD